MQYDDLQDEKKTEQKNINDDVKSRTQLYMYIYIYIDPIPRLLNLIHCLHASTEWVLKITLSLFHNYSDIRHQRVETSFLKKNLFDKICHWHIHTNLFSVIRFFSNSLNHSWSRHLKQSYIYIYIYIYLQEWMIFFENWMDPLWIIWKHEDIENIVNDHKDCTIAVVSSFPDTK